jgi:DNA helicase-2/ATP-dependent DNA helicase PcrA
LYGRIQRNQPSRFVEEINPDLLQYENGNNDAGLSERSLPFGKTSATATTYRSQQKRRYKDAGKKKAPVTNTGTGADKVSWKTGDKVSHKKWGQGTVVKVSGTGNDMELDIAFPQQGVKRLLASFAPITKVD